ncbi:putative O-methyltransferase YrrM [Isoptericola sp. CG 20/1183]|uniref:O-methyltransferase YrrM n=1 Tax=Isoptericola halotolerans TaxID=300560 RepID=A0ABX5E9N7_9MICO|nr:MULTISPECIES: O-methyltransferase [Isoptericola]MCK0116516.1 O-methyltransferase [Isoptericola sp. S6320L]PRZ03062.1 putative O-methyltransferase YrrM [Isoptericola sp. CG 20/1183]PRZ03316.1 putative O-methyltransferase YrrM [Isoptericola halotolerans]
MDTGEQWSDVDDYLAGELVTEDEALVAARALGRERGLPPIEVAPNQGAFLALVARMAGARRVLELGTLAGYSTIWLARAVGAEGHVTTVELDPRHAEVARENLDHAGVGDRVRIQVGPALDVLAELADAAHEPYDLVFIDADKANMAAYLELALRLTRSGSVVVGDNVVRRGAVVDSSSDDPSVRGARAFLRALGADPRLEATALQTVGSKGWDGFAIARVR